MNTIQENIFVVGPEATGDSFFGRHSEIKTIESIFSSVAAFHLVGPTRIGKSSLVSRIYNKNSNYPNRICVLMNMGICQNAFSFWKKLAKKIKAEQKKANLWDDDFENDYADLMKISSSDEEWFTDFILLFECILKNIKEHNYRLVLSIDEFDHVDVVFGKDSHYFQALRSLYSSPECATSGIIISRKRLHLLEAKCPDISTFHGVFDEVTLTAFNDDDMSQYYSALEIYNIKLSSGGKKKFENYTGRLPYLCCMFANRMVTYLGENVSVGDKEVSSIFKECLPQIDRHYENLIAGLEYDNHLETVFYLSVASKFPSYITSRDIENLTTMGVLIPQVKNDLIKYYAYSKDFMTYFRLRPLRLPAWETMTQSEKKIKAIYKKEFPRLDEITYDDLLTDTANSIVQRLNTEYPELNLNSGKIRRYCEDLAAHKEHPTILDVLTLSEVVKVMLDSWATRFHKYFAGDESWKPKLKFIMELRNPMAHAAIEYIDQEDLAVCMKYCDEIIHMKY